MSVLYIEIGVAGLVWTLTVITITIFFERLNANSESEELCKLRQQSNARLEELFKLQQQLNDKVDGIARKIDDIYQFIGQGARSKDIGPLDAEIARSNHYKGPSSKGNTQTGNRTRGNADRTTGSKDSQISMIEENLHSQPSSFEGKSDESLVAETGDLVIRLNSQIEQASCVIGDLVCHRESPISSKDSDDVLNVLCCIEPWLYNKLRNILNTENGRLLITRIILQSGLVNACNHIINHGSPPSDDVTLSRAHSDTVETGQAAADTSQSECCEIYGKYLANIALQLITAVGGSLKSGGALLPQYSDVFDEIVNTSLTVHRAVSNAVTLMELVTYTTPCNTDFDHSQMENTEESGNETDTVVCTVEMGLRCRRRNESSLWEVAKKTKVVLESTLDEI